MIRILDLWLPKLIPLNVTSALAQYVNRGKDKVPIGQPYPTLPYRPISINLSHSNPPNADRGVLVLGVTSKWISRNIAILWVLGPF